MDSVDSTDSLNFKQSENTCQTLNALTNSNESVVVLENKDADMQVGKSSAILEQPEEDHKCTLSSDVNRDKGDCQQGGFDRTTRHSSPSFLEQSHRISLIEESQHQRGMHRRCLQFEESQQETIVKSASSWKITNPAASSSSACSLSDSDVLKPHVEILATGGSTQLANVTQSASPVFSSRDNRNLSTTVSRPAGIGLHLNSIVASKPLDSAVISAVQSANKGNSSLIGRNALSVMRDHVSDNTKNCFNSSNVTVNVLASIEEGRDESNSSATVRSISSLSLHNVKPLNTCLLLKPTEHRLVSCDMEKINSELDVDKEHNQSSIGKKRKKTSSISSSVDCKRCNCKKTKCLKLYCDCFASGIYCAEPCACQGCFNRPDYEDTVSETRQQIESRNPLAFAPKIIQCATRSLATSNRDINQSTPFSARHKRGCNCKKSMCLKKYCECYQACVGCSSGCRCEGCKNTYGRKEEHSLNKEAVSNQDIDGRAEGLFDEKLDLVLVKDDLLHTDTYNTQNFTLTQSIQCSENNALTRFLPGRYLLSPKSNPTFLATYERSLETPRNFNNQDMVAEYHKDVLGFVSFEDLNFGNTEALDQFSTKYHGNMSNLTALPKSSSTMASLMSPKKTTPSTHFERNKLVDVLVSNSRLDNIVEDDTPDILKYDSTPHNTVKASSPNKRRISPPHGHLSMLGSSSSAGVRTGRKFILKAVPFPPLTQCIDLKSSNCQNRNDPEDHCNAND